MQLYSTYPKNLPVRERSSVVTRKGQITVPVEIRSALGLKQGDVVSFLLDQGRVALVSHGSVTKQTAGMLKDKLPPLSPRAEKEAAEQEAAEEVASEGL